MPRSPAGRWGGRRSLAGGGEGEAASLVELHVPDAAHGLDLGLEGTEVVVVSVVAALKQVLVASVSGVLVAHPPEGTWRGHFESFYWSMIRLWQVLVVNKEVL